MQLFGIMGLVFSRPELEKCGVRERRMERGTLHSCLTSSRSSCSGLLLRMQNERVGLVPLKAPSLVLNCVFVSEI